ncbi:MAG: hypothetical protein HQL26_05965 [Candidatus Omnitrophica bacterium]|nr:hypothetical protein [Candidatus Omnitrophota bacterium]
MRHTKFVGFLFLICLFNFYLGAGAQAWGALAGDESKNRTDVINQEMDHATEVLENTSRQAPGFSYNDAMGQAPDAKPDLNKMLNPDQGRSKNESYIKVKGNIRLAVGIKSDEVILQKANYDLYEKSWRELSSNGLNNRVNTYDPEIYDRLQFIIDGAKEGNPFSFHTNISIDPWSYTGKSDRINIQNDIKTESAEIQLLYWSNSHYTVNQNYLTQKFGDSFHLPEFKVHGNKVQATTVLTNWQPFPLTLYIPDVKIHTTFQPVRELWFDVKPSDNFKLRVFPLALEDQVKTSDDPLQLSGHRIYWENSPWLNSWQAGHHISGFGYDSYNPGKWDNSLAYLTRDDNATHLTGLRGFSFDSKPLENTTLTGMFATPKTLWQDYGDFNAIPGSLRVKSFLTDNFYVGDIANMHLGFTDRHEMDAYNAVNGFDAGYALGDNLKADAEVSYSKSVYNKSYSDFIQRKQGNAYYAGLSYTSVPQSNILNTDYNGMRPTGDAQKTTNYRLAKVYAVRMDTKYEDSLSNYRNTRVDQFWSRHLHFGDSKNKFFASGDPSLSMYDITPFAVGDGIDYGRNVVGVNGEINLADIHTLALADIRSIHTSSGKYAQTLSRGQLEITPTPKLTLKIMGLNQDMPKTKLGIDPFITDPDTGAYLRNDSIRAGEDPSVRTVSAGAQYAFIEQIKAHAVWEYTNDFTSGADNFPRTLFNDFYTNPTDGQLNQIVPFLYNQGIFPQPKYAYHNIFRTGLELIPSKQWDINIDYTLNPNKFAGPIDANMNHIGFEVSYFPTERFGLNAKYVWSRWYNLSDLTRGLLNYDHHNCFSAEAKYLISKDSSLVLQYGVGPSQELNTIAFDPYGGTMPVIDTEHIVRAFYNKKF